MKLDFALLADMANADALGKFNIIGEFNVVFAAKTPTQPINIALVARMVAASSEGAEHRVAVALVDADGGGLMRTPEVKVAFSPSTPGTSGDLRAQMVLNLGGIRFPRYGTFSFHILVDGRFLGERSFYVVQPPAGADAQAG